MSSPETEEVTITLRIPTRINDYMTKCRGFTQYDYLWYLYEQMASYLDGLSGSGRDERSKKMITMIQNLQASIEKKCGSFS